MRHRFLQNTVILGTALWLSTEALGAVHQLRRTPLVIWWVAVALAALVYAVRQRRGFPPWKFPRDPMVLVLWLGVATVLALTALTAISSPPNSADAMAYHMPRVIYWAEQSSVRFFPTPYLNQIMLQPLAEYAMLQTYLLSGGDVFINLVQWFASLASVVGVSAIAKSMGANDRGQAAAAVFCATIPAGILASSGAKNDYFLAMWLVMAVYFALRCGNRSDALFWGAALGMSLATKATGYLFAPWVLAAIFLYCRSNFRKAAVAIGVALAINAPQFARNWDLSGSIMGFDSAQGDGFFRWRNETFGWRETASNLLRNTGDQLGGRSPAWNQGVYRIIEAAHRRIGIGINDPATTWRWSEYGPPVNANHEANAPNRWQLALLVVFAGLALRRRAWLPVIYVASLICAFVAFSGYLKWQPFFARLLLPLFVLGAPLAAELGRSAMATIVVCLFLFSDARHALLENWVRPLKGAHSVLHTPRDAQYFSDMSQWNNLASYLSTVELVSRSGCHNVGIDINNLQLEYPLQALLRERDPAVRLIHTGVRNASSKYRPAAEIQPCTVVCLDCAGDQTLLTIYRKFPHMETIGKFAILY